MRRTMSALAIVMTVLALTAATVVADVNWKSGPSFVQNQDGSFTATGEATGLGNKPAIATIDLNFSVLYTCRNKGGNESPGQNPVPAHTSVSQDLGNSDHNGRGVINLTTSAVAPTDLRGKDAGCPNNQWTGVAGQIVEGSLSATLTITQGKNVLYGPVTLP